jgi:hypothetical protein
VDLKTFRAIADRTPSEIAAIREQPELLYAYVGLDLHGNYQLKTVGEALNDRIRAAFKTGHKTVFNLCRSLITDLIREHVIFGLPLDPCYDLLGRLRDSVRLADSGGEIDGDWEVAIKATRDSVDMSNHSIPDRRRFHAREYNVAEAAKFLKQAGYAIRLEPGFIAVEEAAQTSLVAEIERHIAAIGGINVARRLFKQITPIYDPAMGRYHIVPQISMSGGGNPQIPIGYILQLAVKHLEAREPEVTYDTHWRELVALATAYAAVIDVQPYYPAIWGAMDAAALLKYVQEQALYDSMFRFLQLRASDVIKFCRGAFSFADPDRIYPDGWTLNQAFEVISYLTNLRLDVRGPTIVDQRDVRRYLSHLPEAAISAILGNVLSHGAGGPNQHFSLPTDAPAPDDKSKGADFYLKPLIRQPGNSYLIVDRSMCGWGYVEALLTALRPLDGGLDGKVGTAMEKFVEAEFVSHDVEVFSGDYKAGGHGECDIVVPTPKVLVFLELKKKTLTRPARAGSDAELLLGLGGSLLDAHAQLGWHELRITRAGFLDLMRDGNTRRLSLDGRDIEKIALGMHDFGSFQDRILLKQFLEATLNANFGSSNPAYDKRFKKLNAALEEIREQYNTAHAGKTEVRQPFFNCWFMSIPQLLIMLDEVSDPETFRATLWSYRHMVTGTSDLYYEMSSIRRMKAQAAAQAKD